MINFVQKRKANYQAILTIPFYHSGSEDYNYTIDPDDEFARSTMQLAHFTSLPLISSKMGRTSIVQTKALFDIYLQKKILDYLTTKFNSKKILIYVDKSYESAINNWPKNEREPALTVYKTGIDLINGPNCVKIYEFGNIELYEMDNIK